MATEHTKHQVESKERQGVAQRWTRVISLAYYYYYYYYCWRDFDIHCFYHDRFNTGLHFVYMHYCCIDEDLFTTWRVRDMHVCVRTHNVDSCVMLLMYGNVVYYSYCSCIKLVWVKFFAELIFQKFGS